MKTIVDQIKYAWARFGTEERGSIAVEAVVILPLLFWTYLAMFATFHAYRTYAVNQKAAYTISDMISRETNPLDQNYIEGARELLSYLTVSDLNDVSIRLTAVQYQANGNTYDRQWSEALGTIPEATDTEVAGWSGRLPVMPDNELIMVVETLHEYDPPFNTGLINRQVRNFVFARPRYAPQILWN